MPTNKRSILTGIGGALAAALVLAGCEQYRTRTDTITSSVGNSVSYNNAVQTVNPWPPNVGNSRIDVDGQRMGIAVERYQANKSIPPKSMATQTVVGRVGGSGDTGN